MRNQYQNNKKTVSAKIYGITVGFAIIVVVALGFIIHGQNNENDKLQSELSKQGNTQTAQIAKDKSSQNEQVKKYSASNLISLSKYCTCSTRR